MTAPAAATDAVEIVRIRKDFSGTVAVADVSLEDRQG